MLFSQINPYIRYARYHKIYNDSSFSEVVALDVRLFYAIEGNGKIYVKNKEYEMHPSSLLIINSGTPYQIAAPDNFANYIAINFDYTQKATSRNTPIVPVSPEIYKKEMLLDFQTFDDATELSEILYIKEIPFLRKKLTAIITEHTQKLLFYENSSSHILAQCLSEGMRFLKIGGDDTQKGIANHILAYIHENFSQNITNRSIGTFFGYHPNYISTLVNRLTGMPIHQYIIRVRLTNAVNFLENTSHSCDEIAQLCGFCDSAHFSRCFKNHFGVSPSKYKSI